ncbi:hpt domain-containing protein [Purpureocillium lilacinum]|uniref:Hpt domain-containing protein n=1 Tax=Purpureocillium lilacinum TaxID=33203 RepID=A0A179FEN1_PURLI|nr:hpt domain-containing protein [Purpureocillium lilacinum]
MENLEADAATVTSETPIDYELFRQILELDDDDRQHDFSKPLVQDFFYHSNVILKLAKVFWWAGDRFTVAYMINRLLGSAAVMGFSALRNCCESLKMVLEKIESESECNHSFGQIGKEFEDGLANASQIAAELQNLTEHFFATAEWRKGTGHDKHLLVSE